MGSAFVVQVDSRLPEQRIRGAVRRTGNCRTRSVVWLALAADRLGR
jgi:hypothetical protein